MKKNGFTLTELIAVIFIVGLLLSTAAVTVMKYINDAKKETELMNAKSYITAVNDYNFINKNTVGLTTITGEVNVDDLSPLLKNSIDGDLPKSGTVNISDETKKVTSASLVYTTYSISFDGTNYTMTRK